jgi:hypothetical protein
MHQEATHYMGHASEYRATGFGRGRVSVAVSCRPVPHLRQADRMESFIRLNIA